MNVLIVTAHPATWGFTHAIARTYRERMEACGHQVFVMDLYNERFAQPFLCFEDIKKDCPPTDTHNEIQEKIVWAQEIVFVFPIWWFGPPAILKNFLDQNLTAGFAYKYHKDGVRDELLKGRTARIFATADGPRVLYFIAQWVLYIQWRVGILGFCGITLKSFDLFAGMIQRRTDSARAQLLKKVARRAGCSHS